MKDIYIKNANKDVFKELTAIEFDNSYIKNGCCKYNGKLLKIFNLRPVEANILKQSCLSLGFDCAVSRNTITCECEYTDCLLFASESQLKKLVLKIENQPFRLKYISNLIKSQLNFVLDELKINNYVFDWKRPYIMGILNVTPDSFSDGGKYNMLNDAVHHAFDMVEAGADIIDIGGESTRPDAKTVAVEEEINRIIPVITQIRKENIDIPISIDTRNYATAKAAIDAGADIINDVSGFDYDDKLFDYVCKNNIPAIVMHSNKVPAISTDFSSSDIVEDIYIDLSNKINKLIQNGLDRSKIIVDTGIGFGKSQDSCFEILKRHEEFNSLNVPVLVGLSRKSFIRNQFNISIEESDIPTALYSAILMSKKINIHRVHNVKLTKQYLDFAQKLV